MSALHPRAREERLRVRPARLRGERASQRRLARTLRGVRRRVRGRSGARAGGGGGQLIRRPRRPAVGALGTGPRCPPGTGPRRGPRAGGQPRARCAHLARGRGADRSVVQNSGRGGPAGPLGRRSSSRTPCAPLVPGTKSSTGRRGHPASWRPRSPPCCAPTPVPPGGVGFCSASFPASRCPPLSCGAREIGSSTPPRPATRLDGSGGKSSLSSPTADTSPTSSVPGSSRRSSAGSSPSTSRTPDRTLFLDTRKERG